MNTYLEHIERAESSIERDRQHVNQECHDL